MSDNLYLVDKWVYVIWKDARSTHMWEEDTKCPELSEIISVGLVVKITDELIAIAANIDCDDKQRSCVISIPLGSIESIQEMTPNNYLDVPGNPNAGM